MAAVPIPRRSLLIAALAAPLPAGAPVWRGVNITNWFRFPARSDPASLRAYLSDAAIGGLRGAGFTHVRLPVSPEVFDPGPVAEAVGRLQAAGLATLVVPHPATWRLETSAADRDSLLRFWARMAPALRGADPGLTIPEIMNEPVFADDPAGWEALQLSALGEVRAVLPACAVMLTGSLWGGVDGLLKLRPAPDRNLIYSVHFYEPMELTALAAYEPGVDADALAALPFPVVDAVACRAAAGARDARTKAIAAYYCSLGWDAGLVGARLDLVAAWAAANGPVALGEFGASARLNAPARLAWLSTVRQAAERRGMGWTLWGYDDVMGFDVARPPPPEPKLDPAVLAALGLRPP